MTTLFAPKTIIYRRIPKFPLVSVRKRVSIFVKSISSKCNLARYFDRERTKKKILATFLLQQMAHFIEI